MFTIRKEQMDALSKVEVRTVEDRRLGHLRQAYPKEFAALGEEQAREIIQYGSKRAPTFGFKANLDVLKYIEVMVLFGRDFDKDDHIAWAAEILGKRKKPAVKLSALYDEAIKRWKDSQNPAAG